MVSITLWPLYLLGLAQVPIALGAELTLETVDKFEEENPALARNQTAVLQTIVCHLAD
jgi:hypothetical protein